MPDGLPPTDSVTCSVVVLGFNGLCYLEECLGSVTDQDPETPSFEILYVDNASSDGSAEFVERTFPRVRVVRSPVNLGYAGGNNLGFEQALGRYVIFLNQDTVVHRRWLAELLGAFEVIDGLAACHSNIIQSWHPESGRFERVQEVRILYTAELCMFGYVRYWSLPHQERPLETLFVHGTCLGVDRNALRDLPYLFDPDFFLYAEDLDLALRLHSLGLRTALVPKSVVYHKHKLQTDLSWGTLTRTVRHIRNRYLCYFKSSTVAEFTLSLPLVTLGHVLNASEFGLPVTRRVLYFLLLIPLAALGLVSALANLPRFDSKRKHIVRTRRREGYWLLKTLLRLGWRRYRGLTPL